MEAAALNIALAKPFDPADTSAVDTRRDLTFGIYDTLTDLCHCSADVVLAPAGEDGEPDWQKADPANVEALPADEWPEDEQTARRACVMVSNVDGCDWEATFIVRLDDGKPDLIQIHGPESRSISSRANHRPRHLCGTTATAEVCPGGKYGSACGEIEAEGRQR